MINGPSIHKAMKVPGERGAADKRARASALLLSACPRALSLLSGGSFLPSTISLTLLYHVVHPCQSTATPTTHLATRTMVLPTLTSQPPSGSTKRVCIARESRLVCLRGNRGRGRKGGGRLKKRGRREDAKGEEVGATT